MNLNVRTPDAPAEVGLHPRLVSILGLAAVVVGLGYLGRAAFYAATDAWMAPVTLSPDSEAVIENNIHLNEHLGKQAKLQSVIARIDADVRGIEGAMARLHVLQQNGQKAFKWAARSNGQQAESSAASIRSFEVQHGLLMGMMTRQKEATDRVRRNVEAGLSSALDLEHEVQNVNELRLAIEENERRTADLRMQGTQSLRAAKALRAVADRQAAAPEGLSPEVAVGLERDVNVELAITRLEAEHRALLNEKTLATDELARLDDLLKQLKNRPLSRAIVASTDVAFVPYTQLEGIGPGVELVTCTWSLFRCRTVGHVKEVLPGEVVATDPWAKTARGQYAILELTDHEAAKEKTLRARPSR